MKNLIYNAIKISLAVLIAVMIAELLKLDYSITAGVVAMLSILDNRRQTYIVGLKRIGTSVLAILIAGLLFEMAGFSLWVLAVFILIFVPIVTLIRASEALVISTVLVTHIYALEIVTIHVMLNEVALILIGVIIAWAINLHMPNVERDINKLQLDVEMGIKQVLRKISLQLVNQCSIDEQIDAFLEVDGLLKIGLEKAFQYNNNYVLKDYSYYIRYFQMRRQQYEVLAHMEKLFEYHFIGVDQALPLSEFTLDVSKGFSETSTGLKHLQYIKGIEEDYKKSELPKTREEFENRARLFQYMYDLKNFIEIKVEFVENYGLKDY